MYITVAPLHGAGSNPGHGGVFQGLSLADHMCCLVHRSGRTKG